MKADESRTEPLPPIAPAELPPPPLGAALRTQLGQLGPVRTRTPARSLALLLGVGLLTPIAVRLIVGLRPDWAQLPALPRALCAVGWLALLVVPLALAVLPPRGQVLANHRRAGIAAMASIAAALLLVVLAPVGSETDVLGGGVGENLPLAWHCARSALLIALPLLAVGAWLLRRLVPVGAMRIGAALGAAGAAGGGLSLHLGCGYGGLHHLIMGHGGGFVLGVAAGAIVIAAIAAKA
jgi:hypothetical protein